MPSRQVVKGQLWMAIARGLGDVDLSDEAAELVVEEYEGKLPTMRKTWATKRDTYIKAAFDVGAQLAVNAVAAKTKSVTAATTRQQDALVPCKC